MNSNINTNTNTNTNINVNGFVGDINYKPNSYPAYSTIWVPDHTCISYNLN